MKHETNSSALELLTRIQYFTHMNWFANIFRRKADTAPAVPLTIQDIGPAPMTPEPDDAELAAQAVLELMANNSKSFKFQVSSFKSKVSSKKKKTPETRRSATQGDACQSKNLEPETRNLKPETKSADHYWALAERIRQAHEVARQRTLRFVTFCEEQLQNKDLPDVGKGSLSLLEAELYKRIDTVEREGGDLKRRWQHCLAEVTVRRMNINQEE